jgi:hypothetical protein
VTAAARPLAAGDGGGRFGVYCLANDHVVDWFIAFAESLRRHEPDVPLRVIPFDGGTRRIERLADRYSFVLHADDLDVADRAGRRLYPHDGVAAGMFRKLASFWGPFDEFVFFDSDIVVLRSLGEILQGMRRFDRVFVVSDLDPAWVYAGSLRVEMTRRHGSRGFNAGWFATRGRIVERADVERVVEAAAPLVDQFVTSSDQSFMNLCADLCGWSPVTLAELVPGFAAQTWARRRLRRRDDGAYVVADDAPDAGAVMPFVHWAGMPCAHGIPLEGLFLEHRLARATALERARFLGAWWVAHARRRSRALRQERTDA